MDKKFEIITLIAALSRIKNPGNFLWDLAVGKEVQEKTQRFEVHTRDQGRNRVPLVGRREKGKLIEKESFSVSLYSPSHIKAFTINEAEDLFNQQFGKTIYGDNQDVAKKQLAEDLVKLKTVGYRTKLWMLAEFLKTGVVPQAEGAEGVSYGDLNTEVLAGTSKFDDPDADILGYFEKKQLEIQKETGVVIDTIVVSPEVSSAILSNKKIKEYLKETNANTVVINDTTSRKTSGERLVAYLPTLNLTIYSYVDWVKSIDEDEEVALVDKGAVIGLKKGSFRCHYGALALRPKKDERAKIFVNKEVIRTWLPDASEDEELQYFSAPLLVPSDARGWFYTIAL